mmetsp:Transcript_13362/g.31321  ORF Transcript_13362/g.31321 Transcript_13362/m.31321 type:complete len:1132 (+) Transcript_13362:28-3423(+)
MQTLTAATHARLKAEAHVGQPHVIEPMRPKSPQHGLQSSGFASVSARDKSPSKVENILQHVTDISHMQSDATAVLRSLSEGQGQIRLSLNEITQVIADMRDVLAGHQPNAPCMSLPLVSSTMLTAPSPTSPLSRLSRQPTSVRPAALPGSFKRGHSLEDGSGDLRVHSWSTARGLLNVADAVDEAKRLDGSPSEERTGTKTPGGRVSIQREVSEVEVARHYSENSFHDHHLASLSSGSSTSQSFLGGAITATGNGQKHSSDHTGPGGHKQSSEHTGKDDQRSARGMGFRKTASSAARSVADYGGVLPEGWPSGIDVRLQGGSTSPGDAFSSFTSTSIVMAVLEDEMMSERESERVMMRQSPWRRWAQDLVIDPNWRGCVLYDCLSVLLLLYDITVIPAVLAWDMKTEGVIGALMWLTLAFWSVDIVVNFFKGYHFAGELVKDQVEVAGHYLRTYFFPDLCIVLADWISVLMAEVFRDGSSQFGGVKLFRIAKVGRLLRVVGMIRILKYAKVLDDLVDRWLSGTGYIALRMVGIVMALLWFNHLMACTWYSIGVHGPTDTGLRWLDSDPTTLEHGFAYEYFTCVHWAMAQSVLGAIEIPSNNSVERAFTVACLLMGLLVGSSLVSSLSASLVEFQITRQERSQMLRTLRTFLRDNKVPAVVAYNVQKQVIERVRQKQMLMEKDVPALQHLSVSLRVAMRVEMYHGHLCKLPLFWLWSHIHPVMIRALCAEGVHFTLLRPKDTLTNPGSPADVAHVVVSGCLSYQATATMCLPPYERADKERLGPGTWIAECALWTHWVYVGITKAEEASQLCVVDAGVVSRMIMMAGPVADMGYDYRRIYHSRLVEAGPPYSPWPTDLSVPYADFADIAMAIGLEHKILIAETILDFEAARAWRFQNKLAEIEEELEKRRPLVLVPLPEGGFERVIMTTSVRVENKDGWILVQLGRHDSTSGFSPVCQIPSVKQEGVESPRDALERLLMTRLQPMKDLMRLVEVTRESLVRKKMSYKRTNYVTTTFSYEQQHDFDGAWSCIVRDGASLRSIRTVTLSHVQEVIIVPTLDRKSKSSKQRSIYAWLPPETLDNLEREDYGVLELLNSIPFEAYLEYEEAALPANSHHPSAESMVEEDLAFVEDV